MPAARDPLTPPPASPTPALVGRPGLGAAAAGRIALAVALLAIAVFEIVDHGAWLPGLAGAVGPDVALLVGAGAGLARGQLHPRAVPLYNTLHRWWPAVALTVVALPATGSHGLFAGGLAWCAHIAADRACGYGLRDREGFQRAR